MFGKLLDRFFFFQRRKYFIDPELRTRFQKNYTILKKILGFTPRNKSYFIKALTHSSYLELYPELSKSNERLEFLGDSVLSMIVANYLFENYRNEEEGFLTKSRAALVNREHLYITAQEIGLNNIILYNEKYLRDSMEGMQTIYADGLEALIGAIYLDQGLSKTEEFVIERIIKPYEVDQNFLIDTNYKGQLLEYAHSKKLQSPQYIIRSEEGPPHKKDFIIDVYLGDQLFGTGNGRNKKAAEQEASNNALKKLKNVNS
ncbi:MAG: ribonuclease III [Ignavibacteriales bacterium]|nr:MAG: ribonuclease III [Ignavibacteriales bacterium]